MHRIDEIINEIRNDAKVLSGPTITKSAFNDLVAIDNVSVEDPAMTMTDYSHIRSLRVSYSTGEIYDIYVAQLR